MEKAKLPKELYEQFKQREHNPNWKQYILQRYLNHEVNLSIDFETLLQALVNGYEVEQTPEEKAIKYIMDNSKVSTESFYAIKEVLKILNIKLDHDLLR